VPASVKATNLFRRKKPVLISGSVVTAVALGVGLWFFLHHWGSKSAVQVVSPPFTPGSLAVLPLRNLSGDPGQDYFADGITDSLTTDLSHIHSLRVISFQSVQQYKGEHRKSLPEIARELSVDAVLEGSIQKSGNTVMINAQLVHAPTDRHLWAERYTRDTRDLMNAQNEIVLAITEAIKIELTQQERARFERARPIDPEAQSHYFLGRFQFGKGTEEGFRQAILEFEEAIRKEPKFALAYAGIAGTYSLLSSFYMPPREAMPKAEEAARKALAIDPDLAEAHSALGYVEIFYHWNPREGETELLRAIELNPNYSTAYLNYGILLLTQSRFNAGLAELRKAQDLEPTSAFISFQIEWAQFLSGKYEETIAQCKHTLALEPKMAGSHTDMGLAYLYLGNKKEALTELKKAVDLEPNSGNTTNYVYGLAASGEKEEAERVLDAFLQRSKGKYVCAYEIASAYEGMEQRTKALEWLQRGYDEKCDCLVWGNTEPWMAGLRKDPRYKAILAKTGLLREPQTADGELKLK
jgi:TolB-like protein/Tfp pilus assembly protein PilF